MMDYVMRQYAFRLVIILATSVQVTIETREVAARYLQANSMTGLEVIARCHRSQIHLEHFAELHPDVRFVVTLAIPHSLNCFIQIVGPPIGINVDQFNREVGVLRVTRYVKSNFNWPTYFHPFRQWFATVDKDVRPRLHLTLVQ